MTPSKIRECIEERVKFLNSQDFVEFFMKVPVGRIEHKFVDVIPQPLRDRVSRAVKDAFISAYESILQELPSE